jgi:Tfp pilus assembly protein PilF
MTRLLALTLVAFISILTAGCAQFQPGTRVVGLTEVAERPAEKALLGGIRAYEDAQYAEAEKQLKLALQSGLASTKDQAAAHKYLAFVYCTSERRAQCEAAFRAARCADPAFTLSKAEARHPLWGPVFAKSRQ